MFVGIWISPGPLGIACFFFYFKNIFFIFPGTGEPLEFPVDPVQFPGPLEFPVDPLDFLVDPLERTPWNSRLQNFLCFLIMN